MRWLPLLVVLSLLALCGGLRQAQAHALDPALLQLSAMDGGRWRVSLRIPDIAGRPMAISPHLPEGCEIPSLANPSFDGRAWNMAFVAKCPDGLAGAAIGIDGLENTETDALVRYELEPGQAETRRLTASAPTYDVPGSTGRLAVFRSYASLGVTHILGGFDHLLFVFALLLLVRQPKRLLWAVTAFTLAHSITLAAATLGWVTLPSAPVEVVIALSIVFLAYELAKPPESRDPVAERFPALISFAFGLIHGLGFAGALVEIGLPRGDVPLALFSFNVGVEFGQLLFVAAVLGFSFVVSAIIPSMRSLQPGFDRLASYAIGSISAFWVIERFASF